MTDPPRSLAGLHVMLVDDDVRMRDMITTMLEQVGARVTACANGSEALDALQQGVPDVVALLCKRIRKADAVLIATPEYNFSIPGMLKNTLDWLSRVDDQPFQRKPVAVLSAATGPLGGARVQYELRKVLLFLDAMVLGKPEVFIGHAATKFDAHGRCTDVPTRDFVSRQMAAFQHWISQSLAVSPGREK